MKARILVLAVAITALFVLVTSHRGSMMQMVNDSSSYVKQHTSSPEITEAADSPPVDAEEQNNIQVVELTADLPMFTMDGASQAFSLTVFHSDLPSAF